MVNLLTKLYSSPEDNQFFKDIRGYSILRFLIRIISNNFIPFYFKISGLIIKPTLRKEKRDIQLIVSFTTFPARINRIWLVVECLLRQSVLPDRIILWLSKNQFNNVSVLPNRLKKLQSRGLEIVICDEDLASHKKYYYTLKKFPNDILITIDDDFFYSSNLISDLLNLHLKFPRAICCERGHLMKVNENNILPYNQWEFLNKGDGPSFQIFQTSGGGTLYPPKSFSDEVLDKNIFLKFCRNADDIWLNVMAQLNNTPVIKSNARMENIPISYFKNTTLTSVNVHQNKNDVQLKEIRDFYFQKYNKDPFNKLFLSN